MSQELVITVVNECACTETGECTCEDDMCNCDCECIGCETEMIADACACGGYCGCGSTEL